MPRKVEEAARVLELGPWDVWMSTPLVSFDAEHIWSTYEAALRTRLDDAKVTILPIPSVGHKELIERDLSCRPPFDNSGKGYRDALVWHSILEHLKLPKHWDRIVFVTNDHDFDKQGLDPSLRDELPPQTTQVEVIASIRQLLDDQLTKQLESELQEALENRPTGLSRFFRPEGGSRI